MPQSESNIQLIISRWGLAHSALIIIVTLYSIWTESINPIPYLAPFSLIALVSTFPFSYFGTWPNLITIFRFLGMCVTFLLLSHTIWPFALTLTVFVLMDILDGYLARKLNQSSTLGLHLDMEVDSLFVLIMCLYYYLVQDVGIWIVLPGMMRYLYVIYLYLFRKPGFVEKKQKYASVIAGVFFTVLLIGIVIPKSFMSYLLFPGAAAIIISFSISFSQHLQWVSSD